MLFKSISTPYSYPMCIIRILKFSFLFCVLKLHDTGLSDTAQTFVIVSCCDTNLLCTRQSNQQFTAISSRIIFLFFSKCRYATIFQLLDTFQVPCAILPVLPHGNTILICNTFISNHLARFKKSIIFSACFFPVLFSSMNVLALSAFFTYTLYSLSNICFNSLTIPSTDISVK